MSIDGRIKRLMPALSARERAILVLRSWKAGEEEDPVWRLTLPAEQSREFSRYIGLMNAANVQLSGAIRFLDHEVEKLDLRLAWLFSLSLWHLNLAEIDFAAAVVSHESITQSAYRDLLTQEDSRYIKLADAAYLLVSERRAWTDEDLETEHGWQELIVKPVVWQRLCREAEVELAAAVVAGELEGIRPESGLLLRARSFNDWIGRPVTVRPAWASQYHVVSDTRTAEATADRNTLGYLRDAIQSTPFGRLTRVAPGTDASLQGLIATLAETARQIAEARWRDLRAIELLVEEISAAFDEDALLPRYRELLTGAHERLPSLAAQLSKYLDVDVDVEVDMGDPDDGYVLDLRNRLERDKKLF